MIDIHLRVRFHLHVRLTAIALCLGLTGCGEALPGLVASAPTSGQAVELARPDLTAAPGISPAGATLAFISLDGPDPAAAGRLYGAMSRALAAHDVTTAPSASANYLVQGHMSAWRTDKGVAISWVWDVYNSSRRRLHRLEDQVEAAAAGAEPWASLDGAALESVALATAQELAAFLSNTPEAAAAKGPPSTAAVR